MERSQRRSRASRWRSWRLWLTLAMLGGWIAGVLVLNSHPLAALGRQWPLIALTLLAIAGPRRPGLAPLTRRRTLREYASMDGGPPLA